MRWLEIFELYRSIGDGAREANGLPSPSRSPVEIRSEDLWLLPSDFDFMKENSLEFEKRRSLKLFGLNVCFLINLDLDLERRSRLRELDEAEGDLGCLPFSRSMI